MPHACASFSAKCGVQRRIGEADGAPSDAEKSEAGDEAAADAVAVKLRHGSKAGRHDLPNASGLLNTAAARRANMEARIKAAVCKAMYE